jgi:hypothetical protein
MPALVWKIDRFYAGLHTARKLNAGRGQYRIWKDPGSHFRVLHVIRISKTGELSAHTIGEADTLDQAKTIAQAHAAQGRKESAAAVERIHEQQLFVTDEATLDAIEHQLLAGADPGEPE